MFQDGEHQYSPENSNGFLRIFRNCIYSTMMHTDISIPVKVKHANHYLRSVSYCFIGYLFI